MRTAQRARRFTACAEVRLQALARLRLKLSAKSGNWGEVRLVRWGRFGMIWEFLQAGTR
jgi:hypothetical protein